jgi:hypothetical protein
MINYKKMYEASIQKLSVISRIAETIALGHQSNRYWETALKDVVSLMRANTGSIYINFPKNVLLIKICAARL